MKKQKQYPMNGPSLEIQRLMGSPRLNRDRLQAWAQAKKDTMRPETLAVCNLK